MANVNQCQDFGSSPINAGSPFAERDLTLSDIDSMYQNGDISHGKAKEMAFKLLQGLKATKEVYLAVLLA